MSVQNVPTVDQIIAGPMEVCLNGISLGLTVGGANFNVDQTFEDVRGDQTRSLIGRFKTQADYTVTLTMASLSLDKLRFIYGQPASSLSAGGDVLCINDAAACSFPEEYPLTICGAGPDCGCRTYHFPKVIVTPTTISNLVAIDSFAQIEVEFTILPDSTGLVGCITDNCGQIATDVNTLVAYTCTAGAFPAV